MTGLEQAPVAVLQVPAAWHESSAAHITGLPPVQVPAWQESLWVHASPSSQAVPSALLEQAPPPPVDEVLAPPVPPVDEALAPPVLPVDDVLAPPVLLVDDVLAPPAPPVDDVLAPPALPVDDVLAPPADEVEALDAEVSVGELHPREWASRPRKSAAIIEDRFMMSLALRRRSRGDGELPALEDEPDGAWAPEQANDALSR